MNGMVLDVSGKPFAGGSHLRSAIAQALMEGRSTGLSRFDAATGEVVGKPGWVDAWRKRSDAKRIQVAVSERRDAFGPGVGAFPRDFEYIYEEILEEARPDLNLWNAVQMDTRVPLGFKTHTVRRRLGQGHAGVVRGGSDVPVVSGSYVEERFPVIYIANAVEMNFFEMLAQSVEGRNQFQDDSALAVRLINERINQIGWFGHKPSKMYGLLDYPSLAKTISPVVYGPAGTPKDILADLNAAANFAREASKETFRPNRMAVSPRLRNYLFQTPHGTVTDTTIGEYFLAGQPDIKGIDSFHELEGVGPGGLDGIFTYADGRESTAFSLVQAPTAMPMWQSGPFTNQVVYFAAIGGAVMRNVGANSLRFVEFRG